jgi:cytochrome c2
MNTVAMAAGVLIAGLGAYMAAALPQAEVLPGSVRQGEQVIRTKGCLDCHAIRGVGGNRAPDFASLSNEAETPTRLATALWNHSPRMWAEYSRAGRNMPSLNQNDVADFYSFFFATLYFEPHGSAARGRYVFVEKNCSSCHSEVLNAEALDPFLNRWTRLRDPLSWAEQFWNHTNEMSSATSLRGVQWPELSARDIADLMTFLSNLPGAATVEGPAFNVGEPLVGKAVFERSCASCHSLGVADKTKVDLLKKSRQSSVAGYVAAMWNHAPQMRRRGGNTPKLEPGEMQDVIAYLFIQQYFYETGDADKGRRLYESKGCVGCHEGSRTTGAPNLAGKIEAYSPITMGATVWRHGADMFETLRNQGRNWPELQGSDMADLIAYLNSRRRPLLAN